MTKGRISQIASGNVTTQLAKMTQQVQERESRKNDYDNMQEDLRILINSWWGKK